MGMKQTDNVKDLEFHLRLALAPGLGPVLTRRLLDAFGSARAIAGVTINQLKTIEGIGQQMATRIRRGMDDADVGAELARIEQMGLDVITYEDAAYPPLLRHIHDPPAMLYVRGRLERNDSLGLGVVGARKCTRYGREQADFLSAGCAQAGMTIVSGGARGIDSAAHRAAIRVGGRTLVVLGCGLGHCYPPENDELFDEIVERDLGAIITELPVNTAPAAENFPRRNRIISGLSVGTLVVEAGQRSGALITARLAVEEHHREVLAVPGPIDSPASVGTNRIIKEGWAHLVTSTKDILDALGETGAALKQLHDEGGVEGGRVDHGDGEVTAARSLIETNKRGGGKEDDDLFAAQLTPEQQQVMGVLDHEAWSLDDVAERVEMDLGQLQGIVTYLELTGHVERLPGNKIGKRR